MDFQLIGKDVHSKARVGLLHSDHGTIETPIFMPVGTAGSVKSVHQHELENDIHAQIILGNTYHLFLRPGIDVLQQAGGLHAFNSWKRPILTDSGGYQVYSLAKARKISEEGVRFQSHIDGNYHFFSPENVIDTQRAIGADIIMAFDECTPYPCDYHYAKKSMQMTHRWLQRCMNRFHQTHEHYQYKQALFPIVQGSVYKELRIESAQTISSYNAHGNAIGGLSVGEPHETLYEICELVCDILPNDKPRYLMGVGTPQNLLECIALGVDMFDCVMPTRNARHGLLFTRYGTINIKNEKWKNDHSPLDENGTSFVDKQYSKAYLRHLIKSNEILGMQIASIHNLAFYLKLVGDARQHIIDGTFTKWKNETIKQLNQRL